MNSLKSPTKSCMLDPIPTSITKQCFDDIVSLITFIVNASLSTGIVPPQFKQTIVTPLLKKPGLDTNDMNNFRPVSNLSFISKILEKVVLIQLKNHLSGNNLFEIFQSTYRQNHITETAVLSVLDGLLGSADERLVSLVALLDLSATFDTLDHPILLKRLETPFSARVTVLDWSVSYLSGRFQSVIVDGVVSASRPLVYSVPQGSVLGPVLFTLYSQPLTDVIYVHNCDYHKYADDTELSKSAPPDQFFSVQSCIQTYIDDVLLWMNSNKLKLNTDKTEITPVVSASCLESVFSESANIGGNNVPFKTSVKYLGVHLDRTLSMQKHIISICCASFLELRSIASVRPYLSQSAAARFVAAVVISRLDYCNSVFIGLPADQIARLQQVQNNAARLVMKKKRKKKKEKRKKKKEEDEITLHRFSRNFTGYQQNSAVSTRLQLLLTAILKGLYLLIFLHLSAQHL